MRAGARGAGARATPHVIVVVVVVVAVAVVVVVVRLLLGRAALQAHQLHLEKERGAARDRAARAARAVAVLGRDLQNGLLADGHGGCKIGCV